jgi:hypothetical protein
LPAPLAPARASRGLALGFPIAVAALAFASFAASALAESLPRPLRWLSPAESLGVSRMLVGLVFAVRDHFSAWFDFAFAVAALGAFASVAYLAANVLLRRTQTGARAALALLVFGAAFALAPEPASARIEVRDRDEVTVPAGETVEASLVAIGDSVTIEGTVRGDLIALGDRVRIRGTVEGNVFCAGEQVELEVVVRGSVHCAGRHVRAAVTTQGSLYAAGDELTVLPEAKIGADLAVVCNECRVGGSVARDLLAGGDSVALEGSAGRDVSVHASELSFGAEARYPGALELSLPKGKEPDLAPGAALGAITRHVLDDDHDPGRPLRHLKAIDHLRGHAMLVFAAFLVGLALFALAPSLFDARVESVGRFFGAVGVGFITLIALAGALVLLLVSMIGIPLALFGGLLLAATVFVGPVVVAVGVGRAITRAESTSFRDFALALGVGLLLLGVLTALPGAIGACALWILVLEGVGLLTLETVERWRARRAARLDDSGVPA